MSTNGCVTIQRKPSGLKIGLLYTFGFIPIIVGLISLGGSLNNPDKLAVIAVPLGPTISFFCGKAIGNAQKSDRR
jgi:hypothetical protein